MLTLQTIETIEKRIKLATGVELAYVEQGDPAGVPVIFLHGITDSWHSFEPVLPHLSEHPAAGYWPQNFAADVAALWTPFSLSGP